MDYVENTTRLQATERENTTTSDRDRIFHFRFGHKIKFESSQTLQEHILPIMSSVITASPAELNRLQVKFHPELASEYAKCPMNHERWYKPAEKGPKGEPCFIKGGSPKVLKKDYVYCKFGMYGPGYYSLMTKCAWVNLYTKHMSIEPFCGCACNAKERKLLDEHDTVRRLLYGRHFAPRPTDEASHKRAMDESIGMSIAAFAGQDPEAYLVSHGAKGARLR